MTPIATLDVPEVIDAKELSQKLQTLAERGLAIRVTNLETLKMADEFISDCLAMEKEIKSKFEKPKAKAAAAHKELCAWEKAELEKVTPGKEHARSEKFAFELAEKKKREAEEARLRKEAEAREEAERLEHAAEIEREAAKLKESGQVEEAEAVQQEAVQVMNTPTYVPPPRMAPAPKTKNVMKMVVDRGRLETVAASLNNNPKATPPAIPGVRFYQMWHYEVYNATAVPEAYRKPA